MASLVDQKFQRPVKSTRNLLSTHHISVTTVAAQRHTSNMKLVKEMSSEEINDELMQLISDSCTTKNRYIELNYEKLRRLWQEPLVEIANRQNFTHTEAKAHAEDVWRNMQGKGPAHHPAVREAWEILPGTYSYYRACLLFELMLRPE